MTGKLNGSCCCWSCLKNGLKCCFWTGVLLALTMWSWGVGVGSWGLVGLGVACGG